MDVEIPLGVIGLNAENRHTRPTASTGSQLGRVMLIAGGKRNKTIKTVNILNYYLWNLCLGSIRSWCDGLSDRSFLGWIH